MANETNLVPFDERTESEQREICKKGGRASGIKRRQLKTLADELKSLLKEELTDKKGRKMSTQTAISTALINAAIHGNVKAFNAIRDTIGQKPKEEFTGSLSLPVIVDDLIPRKAETGLKRGAKRGKRKVK